MSIVHIEFRKKFGVPFEITNIIENMAKKMWQDIFIEHKKSSKWLLQDIRELRKKRINNQNIRAAIDLRSTYCPLYYYYPAHDHLRNMTNLYKNADNRRYLRTQLGTKLLRKWDDEETRPHSFIMDNEDKDDFDSYLKRRNQRIFDYNRYNRYRINLSYYNRYATDFSHVVNI